MLEGPIVFEAIKICETDDGVDGSIHNLRIYSLAKSDIKPGSLMQRPELLCILYTASGVNWVFLLLLAKVAVIVASCY